jgi:ribosomal protein S18 acetylase RimI-like enzyme
MPIRQLDTTENSPLSDLTYLLMECVDGGASIGFLAPLSAETAEAYWQGVLSSLDANLLLWVAEEAGEVVGTVQLSLCPKENGRHRAEVQKLMVKPSHRGRGIASLLMTEAEHFAKENGRTLLVLDTEAGSPAEKVYQRLGWIRAGEIPNYASTPQGILHPTAYYYKIL